MCVSKVQHVTGRKTGCNRSRPVFFGFSIFRQTSQLATEKSQNLCNRNRWSGLLQWGSVRFRASFQSSELDLRTLHGGAGTLVIVRVGARGQWWRRHAKGVEQGALIIMHVGTHQWWWGHRLSIVVVVGPCGRLRGHVVGAPCCCVAVFVLSSCLCRGPCIWCEVDMTKGGSYLPPDRKSVV